MAARTLTDKVDELNRAVANLTARLDYHDKGADRFQAQLDQMLSALQELKTRQALLEERVSQLLKSRDESSHWRSSLFQQLIVALFGGVLGAGLTLLIQFLSKTLW